MVGWRGKKFSITSKPELIGAKHYIWISVVASFLGCTLDWFLYNTFIYTGRKQSNEHTLARFKVDPMARGPQEKERKIGGVIFNNLQ